MEKDLTILHRAASVVVAVAVMAVGFLLVVLGLTFLPVIGILIGIPVMGLSLSFLFPKVRVEESAPVEAEAINEADTLCPWPQAYSSHGSSLHQEGAV